MLMFGLRLGDDPRTVLTGTPKPLPLVRMLLKDPKVHVTRGATYDNLANLAPPFAEKILAKYEGTRLGRQELLGEVVDDVEGALWTYTLIEACRWDRPTPPELVTCVVAVDPAGGGRDETGIVVVGMTPDKRGVVLADRSCRDSPHGWATRAIGAYEEFKADRIVGETNYGGDMVLGTLRSAGFTGRFEKVTASRGKVQRAEPVAALYEQGAMFHVGPFPDLETQMAEWVPDSRESPDRLDALVWGVTALKIMNPGQGSAFLDAWRSMASTGS